MKSLGNLNFGVSASALALFVFVSITPVHAQDAPAAKPKAKVVLDQDNYVPGASMTGNSAAPAASADAAPATEASAASASTADTNADSADAGYDVLAYKQENAKGLEADIAQLQSRIQTLADQIEAEKDSAKRSPLVRQKERSEEALKAMLSHQQDLNAEIEKLKAEKPESETKPTEQGTAAPANDQGATAAQQNGTGTAPQ
jgi:chromosome segregation ATPase